MGPGETSGLDYDFLRPENRNLNSADAFPDFWIIFKFPPLQVLTVTVFAIILPWCRQLSTNCRHHEQAAIELDLLHKIIMICTLMR